MEVIYAGSFDPATKGHLNIIQRASKMFERVYVVIMENSNKGEGYFSMVERLEILETLFKDFDNVVVDSHKGLAVQYAQKVGTPYFLRGVRGSEDLAYEQVLSNTNKIIGRNEFCLYDIETIFMLAEHSDISSSLVRSLIPTGVNLNFAVPKLVEKKIREKEGKRE